jgi:hypothetical protein
MGVKVYLAHAMTGRTGEELLAESKVAAQIAAKYNVELLDPVVAENVARSKRPLHNKQDALAEYWRRDKEMIRAAHVLLDYTGPAKSEGVAHEIGYARFGLWKPVVRIWPKLGPSVAWIEDDIIANDPEFAFFMIDKLWGSKWKRFKWRFKMLNKSLPKWLYYQALEWK